MLKKGTWFTVGWIYLILMFGLAKILPTWVGEEDGIIENMQLLWLFAGLYTCLRIDYKTLSSWGGNKRALLHGGVIYFFMLIMREINWGRALFRHDDGSFYQYSDFGIYGHLVHPIVAILIIFLMICLFYGKVWNFFRYVKIPVKDFVLLLIFIFMDWVAEKASCIIFNGMVAEELAEFGAYMMMFKLLKDALNTAKNK